MSIFNLDHEIDSAKIPIWYDVPFTSVREISSNTIPNTAGNGGLLASDTTPILATANGDTDSSLDMTWAASNSDPILFEVPVSDHNPDEDLTVRFRAKMGGSTDTPTLALDSYFNNGDTKVEDASAAVDGTSYANYDVTIDADDIPSDPHKLTIEVTPGAHTTDTLVIAEIRVGKTWYVNSGTA